MTRTRGPRARVGMTLMELMVAVAITGMMTAAGYGAFASLIDHRRALREATFRLERAAALRETIDGWLASGRPVQIIGGGPTGARGGATGITGGGARAAPTSSGMSATTQTAAVAATPDADLTMTTTALTPSFAPNTRLRLYIDADDDTPEQGLTIEYIANQINTLHRQSLDTAVTGMLVEFLDGRTHQWVRPSAGTAAQPLAVRVTLSQSEMVRGDSLPGVLRLPFVRAIVDPVTLVGPLQSAGLR